MIILVPCMKATRKSNYTISMFPPYSVNIICNRYQRLSTLTDKTMHKISLPETKHDLIMPQMSVIINRKDGFCLNCIKRKESIIQTVSWSFYYLFNLKNIFMQFLERCVLQHNKKITLILHLLERRYQAISDLLRVVLDYSTLLVLCSNKVSHTDALENL